MSLSRLLWTLLLLTYLRLLLAELKAFEKSRKTRDPETGESLDGVRWRYKISQAVWASRFEATGGRMLQVDDELIRINPRKPRKTPVEK